MHSLTKRDRGERERDIASGCRRVRCSAPRELSAQRTSFEQQNVVLSLSIAERSALRDLLLDAIQLSAITTIKCKDYLRFTDEHVIGKLSTSSPTMHIIHCKEHREREKEISREHLNFAERRALRQRGAEQQHLRGHGHSARPSIICPLWSLLTW